MGKGLDIMNKVAQAMGKSPKEKVMHQETMQDSHEVSPADPQAPKQGEDEQYDLDNDQGDESGHQDPAIEDLEKKLQDLHMSIKAIVSRRSGDRG